MSVEQAIQSAVVRADLALTSPWVWIAVALIVLVAVLSRWR